MGPAARRTVPLAEATDDENRAFLDRINDPKRVYLSSTTIEGRHIIRACIVSHRTHRDRIDEAIEIIRRAVALPRTG